MAQNQITMAEKEGNDSFSDGSEEFSIIDSQTLEEELNSLDTNSANNTKLSFDEQLSQSKHAMVVFYEVHSSYVTGMDIHCRYTLTEAVTPAPGDRISLFKVGWNNISEELASEKTPMPTGPENNFLNVIFKANTLPKDTSKYYQFCYINRDYNICGTSISFQFRAPTEAELCEVDLPEGIVEIRSHGSLLENQLTSLMQEKEKNEFAQEKLQNDLEKLQIDFDIVNSKWQTEISKVAKILLENTGLNNQLSQKNIEIEAKDKKIDGYQTELSKCVYEMKILKMIADREQMLTGKVQKLEKINKTLIDDKKLTLTELQSASLQLNEALAYISTLESRSVTLEKQKDELVDCNLLLKKEVENMLTRCEDLKKLASPLIPVLGFNPLIESNKIKVQDFIRSIDVVKNELQTRNEKININEKQFDILQDLIQELTLKLDRESTLNQQLREENKQLLLTSKENITIQEELKKMNEELAIERDNLKKNISEKQKTKRSTINQVIDRFTADIADMKLKLCNTHDIITQNHESRVEASKSRREILDKLDKVSEDSKKFEESNEKAAKACKLMKLKMADVQANMLKADGVKITDEENLLILIENMTEVDQYEEIIAQISLEMINCAGLHAELNAELLFWDRKIKHAADEISQSKESANEIEKCIESASEQLKKLQNLSEYEMACEVLADNPNCDESVAILTDRLQQASVDYQNVLIEKQRLEKLKLRNSSAQSVRPESDASVEAENSENCISSLIESSEQELASHLMDLPVPDPTRNEPTSYTTNVMCPLCSNIFTQQDIYNHFQNHLS